MEIIVGIKQPLIVNTKYIIERLIGVGSDISVKVDEIVRPETIIATYWQRSGFRTFNLAEMFKVTPEKASMIFKKTLGTRIYPGDIVATKQELFGLREKYFKSPLAGILTDFDTRTARLTIQYLPKEIKIVAGVFGRIVDIKSDKAVAIETKADIVKGVLSFGMDREGSLVEIGYPDIPLQADQLSERLSGKIIFGGTKVNLDFVYKSLSYGIKGIITGGIDYQDYLALQGSRGRDEDIGVSLIITEGFMSAPIYHETYDKLKEALQKHVIFNAGNETIVLPVANNSNLVDTTSVQEAKSNQKYNLLDEGNLVQIINGENIGQYGTVNKIMKENLIEVINNHINEQTNPLNVVKII